MLRFTTKSHFVLDRRQSRQSGNANDTGITTFTSLGNIIDRKTPDGVKWKLSGSSRIEYHIMMRE
jgi:hypothetical protein